MFILSISSTAVIYSAWYMNLPIFSLGWFVYCLSWIPLLMIFVSASKYDHKNRNTHDLPMPIGAQKSHSTMQK
jgi:hypothetical protein